MYPNQNRKLNMSSLLKRIKMDLGIYSIPLPFDNTDEMLADVIIEKTLRSFDVILPAVKTIEIDLKELETTYEDFQKKTYILPEFFEHLGIINIYSLDPVSAVYNANFYQGISPSTYFFNNSSSLYNEMMLGQVGYDLISQAAPAFTFEFEYPNILTIYNLNSYSDRIRVKFGYQHPANLSTIKETSQDAFIELAKLDIKAFLYNNLKYYDNISTAFANLNLMLDQWADAESQRAELYREYSEETALNTVEQFIII